MNRLLLTCYCFLMGLILYMARTDNSKTALETNLGRPSQQNKLDATTPPASIQQLAKDTSVASLWFQR